MTWQQVTPIVVKGKLNMKLNTIDKPTVKIDSVISWQDSNVINLSSTILIDTRLQWERFPSSPPRKSYAYMKIKTRDLISFLGVKESTVVLQKIYKKWKLFAWGKKCIMELTAIQIVVSFPSVYSPSLFIIQAWLMELQLHRIILVGKDL